MSARILVFDDSPTIRKVVCSILEASAFLAVPAQDGQEALELLVHEKVDLVLLDFVMPRMNGYQFCRELRAKEELKNLPVVLMSAKGDKIRGQFVQQTGAIDAITKPFDAQALVAVIENALRKINTSRASSMGLRTWRSPVTAPAANVLPSMIEASSSAAPSRVSTDPRPALNRGLSSRTTTAACAASRLEPFCSSTAYPASSAWPNPA
jgi:DNA-binding response OmpR family regulator